MTKAEREALACHPALNVEDCTVEFCQHHGTLEDVGDGTQFCPACGSFIPCSPDPS